MQHKKSTGCIVGLGVKVSCKLYNNEAGRMHALSNLSYLSLSLSLSLSNLSLSNLSYLSLSLSLSLSLII